jgi:hypothetical protein
MPAAVSKKIESLIESWPPNPRDVINALNAYARVALDEDLSWWGGELKVGQDGGGGSAIPAFSSIPTLRVQDSAPGRASAAPAWLHALRTVPLPTARITAEELNQRDLWRITFQGPQRDRQIDLQILPRKVLMFVEGESVHVATFPAPIPRGWAGPLLVRAGAVSSSDGRELFVWVGRHLPSGDLPAGSVWTAMVEAPREETVWNVFVVARTGSGPEQLLAQLTLVLPANKPVDRPHPIDDILSVDVGTATTVAVYDTDLCETFGDPTSRDRWCSGWGLVSGPPESAWRVGCGQYLRRTQGYLPTALAYPRGRLPNIWQERSLTDASAADVLGKGVSWEQLWLPQEPSDDALDPHPTVTRFKTFRLLRLGGPDLAGPESKTDLDLKEDSLAGLSCDLLAAWYRWLGLHLAWSATKERDATTLSVQRLGLVDVVASWPEQPVRVEGRPSYRDLVKQAVDKHLAPSLRAAWADVRTSDGESDARYLPAEMDALAHLARHAVQPNPPDVWPAPPHLMVVAHLGGMSLDLEVQCVDWGEITARSRHAYVLGAEIFFDVVALASLPDGPAHDRHRVRDAWQSDLFTRALHPNQNAARKLHELIVGAIIPLIARQVEVTPHRLPHLPTRFDAAPVFVVPAGEGWRAAACESGSESATSVEICLKTALSHTMPGRVVVVFPRQPKAEQARHAIRIFRDPTWSSSLPSAEAIELCATTDHTLNDGTGEVWYPSRAASPEDGPSRKLLARNDNWFNEWSHTNSVNSVLIGISIGLWDCYNVNDLITSEQQVLNLEVSGGSTFLSTWINRHYPSYLLKRAGTVDP